MKPKATNKATRDEQQDTTIAQTSDARAERGSITFFGIGMVMVLLFVGGLSVDLWRVFGERRALAELADAAAAAGSNGVDLAIYRDTGVVVLDPGLATDLAWDSIERQADKGSLTEVPLIGATPELVVVEVHGQVELTLLKIFAPGDPLEISVIAESAPVRGLP